MDFGSYWVKAAWKRHRPASTSPPSAAKHVRLDGESYLMRSQLSYTMDQGTEHHKLRCGSQVDDALLGNIITINDVFDGVRSFVLGEDTPASNELRDKAAKLPTRPQQRRLLAFLKECGQDLDESDIRVLDLFVMLAAYCHRLLLQSIDRENSDLGIRKGQPQDQDSIWTLPSNIEMEVAIPLPAVIKPHQRARMVAVLLAAGITGIYLVAEPMSLLASQLQSGTFTDLRNATVIVVDIGSMTIDMQPYLVISVDPPKVIQISGSATSWYDGECLDQDCVDYIDEVEGNALERVTRLRQELGSPLTWEQLKLRIKNQFNIKKKFFDGSESRTLFVRGLPKIADSRMIRGETINLTGEDLRHIWKNSIIEVNSMAANVIQDVKIRTETTFNSERKIKILMGGGGSLCDHMREGVTNRFADKAEVLFPGEQAFGSATIAQGAIKLLENKELIAERVPDYGYAITQWKEIQEFTAGTVPTHLVARGPDGIQRVLVAKIISQPGVPTPNQWSSGKLEGFRQLKLSGKAMHNHSWPIEEDLLYFETASQDGVPIDFEDPANPFKRMPTPIQFSIPYKWAELYEWELQEDADRSWYEVQYYVVLQMDGERMRFEITLPRRGGKFKRDANRKIVESDNPLDVKRFSVDYIASGSYKFDNIRDS